MKRVKAERLQLRRTGQQGAGADNDGRQEMGVIVGEGARGSRGACGNWHTVLTERRGRRARGWGRDGKDISRLMLSQCLVDVFVIVTPVAVTGTNTATHRKKKPAHEGGGRSLPPLPLQPCQQPLFWHDHGFYALKLGSYPQTCTLAYIRVKSSQLKPNFSFQKNQGIAWGLLPNQYHPKPS